MRFYAAAFLTGGLFVASACDAPRRAPSLCEFPLGRLPGDDVSVFRVGEEGALERLPVRCSSVYCLRTEGDAVAVRGADGRVWAAWPGQPGKILPKAPAAESLTPEEQWARTQGPAGATDRARSGPVPPSLPPELRTCGTTTAGGGVGFHVILNEGSVWQRIHWVREPRAAEVRRLSSDAYPIARPDGSLCAYATQVAPRTWQVHVAGYEAPLLAAPDHEHPPARCLIGGQIGVRTPAGWVRMLPDGSVRPAPELDTPSGRGEVLELDVKAPRRSPKGPLRVRLPDGSVYEHPYGLGFHLDGRPLQDGVKVERIALGNGGRMLLVIDRVTGPDCAVREALYRIRVDTGQVTRLREGDQMILRLRRSGDRLYWVEARPRLLDLRAKDAP